MDALAEPVCVAGGHLSIIRRCNTPHTNGWRGLNPVIRELRCYDLPQNPGMTDQGGAKPIDISPRCGLLIATEPI